MIDVLIVDWIKNVSIIEVCISSNVINQNEFVSVMIEIYDNLVEILCSADNWVQSVCKDHKIMNDTCDCCIACVYFFAKKS